MPDKHKEPEIYLSLAFAYIHRPYKTSRFASHSSLEELPKILKEPPASPPETPVEVKTQPPVAPVPVAVANIQEEMISSSDAKLQLSLKYNRKTATLSVVVHRVRHMPSNFFGYVKIRLIERLPNGRNMRVINTKRRTSSQREMHAIFEETLTYLLPPHELKMRRLETSVCQEARLLGANSALLSCVIGLESIQEALLKGEDTPTVTNWYFLMASSSS